MREIWVKRMHGMSGSSCAQQEVCSVGITVKLGIRWFWIYMIHCNIHCKQQLLFFHKLTFINFLLFLLFFLVQFSSQAQGGIVKSDCVKSRGWTWSFPAWNILWFSESDPSNPSHCTGPRFLTDPYVYYCSVFLRDSPDVYTRSI